VKIIWSRRAIRHLVAVRNYIAKDSPQNAATVAARIMKSVDLLATQPHMGRPGRVMGTRELVVPDTPYVIPYRVRGESLELIAGVSRAAKVAAEVLKHGGIAGAGDGWETVISPRGIWYNRADDLWRVVGRQNQYPPWLSMTMSDNGAGTGVFEVGK
jgi:plasmid stabilization system protein ParE